MQKKSTTSRKGSATNGADVESAPDYEREGRELRHILLSDQVSANTKDVFRFYLSQLAVNTGVIQMDDALVDWPHIDAEVLPLLYPIMRERDGGGDGIPTLIDQFFHSLGNAEGEVYWDFKRAAQGEVRPPEAQGTEEATATAPPPAKEAAALTTRDERNELDNLTTVRRSSLLTGFSKATRTTRRRRWSRWLLASPMSRIILSVMTLLYGLCARLTP